MLCGCRVLSTEKGYFGHGMEMPAREKNKVEEMKPAG